MILVDHREKNSLIVSDLIEKGQELRMEQLEVGDYIIGDIVIERKSLSDFISSMMSKRLMVQIQNLKQFPRQMLILESSPSSIRIHPNAVRGMLLSIILDFGIPIIFSKSPEESAEFLILLDKRQNKEPHEHSLSMKRIGHTLQERQQIVLESFPGIGPVSAKMLLKKFKTIKRIFDAKKEDLEKHLDSSKVEEIRKILDYPYPD